METIEVLNQRLKDHYGTDVASNKPIFRIVWADDEVERRYVHNLDSGIILLFPEVREVKKYSYLPHLYVLERLSVVPEEQQRELGLKVSYEPIWAYADDKRNPLPPIWDATKLVIDALYAALGKSSMAKYTDTEENTTIEGREQRITKLHEELFGDETETGDALRYKEGIVVPSNYSKEIH
jgi:hypothetical protein